MQEASCNPKAVAFAGDVYVPVAGVGEIGQERDGSRAPHHAIKARICH